MTSKQARAIAARLAHWLGVSADIELATVDVDALDADGTIMGDCDCYWQFDTVRIRVAARRSNKDVVRTMLHECLHALKAEAIRAIERGVAGLSDERSAMIVGAVEDAQEREVRTLTKALLPQAMKLWREVKKEVGVT